MLFIPTIAILLRSLLRISVDELGNTICLANRCFTLSFLSAVFGPLSVPEADGFLFVMKMFAGVTFRFKTGGLAGSEGAGRFVGGLLTRRSV